ncbi:MAG: DUF2024 family protein [Gammaproteobacteria bacterium]
MEIDVYDSYAKTTDGRLLHFDVFVRSGTDPDVALRRGREWLASIDENPAGLEQSRCNFCHTEAANPEVQRAVEFEGFFILQMEGCPAPV